MLCSLTLLCISEDLSHKIILYQSTVCAYASLILLFSKISFLTDIVKSRESRLAAWLGGGGGGGFITLDCLKIADRNGLQNTQNGI